MNLEERAVTARSAGSISAATASVCRAANCRSCCQVCPTCNGGIKQTRGFRWIDPKPWLSGYTCTSSRSCPAADPIVLGDRVGLLWIGAKFYPTPADFMAEACTMGVSRRLVAVPRGFKLGETWVFLAHPRSKRSSIRRPADDLLDAGGKYERRRRSIRPCTETQANDEAARSWHHAGHRAQ
jgi:hypothetical protein